MILVMNAIWIVATLALVPFLLFFVAITLAAYLGRPRLVDGLPTQSRSRFLIVIPAHDEAGVIGTTVRSCLALDYDPSLFSIYVIADNCTDSTADEAREAGASVVERSDPNSRSKGHALDYFFTHIPAGNPEAGHDATVIVDADTLVDPGLLRVFDRALVKGKDWLQGYYSVSNPDASWRTRMMTYAFSLANGVWMVGLDRLGLGVGLKGNGMCFSSRGLRRFPWKAHGLVEDMEFALMLRVQGERVSFEPEARVFGEMVSRGGAGAASQRRRWEVGRRSLRGTFAGPLIRSPSLMPTTKVCYLLDLVFPPLGFLGPAFLLVSTPHLFRTWNSSFSSTAIYLGPIHATMLACLVSYAASPLFVMKLPARYLASLLAVPYYLIWKLFIVMGRRPQAWVRTPRES